MNTTQTLGSGTAFETFAKPQIIPLPGSHYYDYMFVWVKSGDRKIYYSFAKHISGDTSFISVSTPVLLSGSYEILTSPSIAINDNGTEVLFVFQQISENTTIENQEYLYFSKLNLTTNTFTTPTQITTEGIHTNSVPTVIWNEKTGRWIIFWVNRDRTNWMSNWTVKYLVSNNASPSLSSHWNHDKINDFTTTKKK